MREKAMNSSTDNGFGMSGKLSSAIKGGAVEDEVSPLEVTAVEWNSTGAIVMASYGVKDATGWCNSKGAVAAWNLSARDFDAEKPSVTLEHSSYIMCIASHPDKPALFCAGSFNGEILLFDLSLEEPLVACSKIDDYFHREPISSLCWTWSMVEGDYQVGC